MSEEDRVDRERAELVETDRVIGLEASLATARSEIDRLRRIVAKLEAERDERTEEPAPRAGLLDRLRRPRS